ncbi:hypothetical protein ACFY8X_05730, partial [Streptomyces tanashiensis]|uniref:hypothetical protein n=1 Tax=Streptomyces tanashiensis TaxID=67367 RepID=UPI0036EB044A
FQRNLDHPKMDGVSTNLALIFGTLLSSQGADASFVPVSRPSGRFLRFRLYQIFPIRFPRCFPVPFAFAPGPSGVSTTLADFFGDS